MEDNGDGASPNERLLAAARSDNEDLLLEVFEQGGFDINCVDPLGNTPLHLAVSNGSTTVLEHILTCEGCDVDPQNRLDRDTPLHLAVKYPEEFDIKRYLVESLLDAGADTSIKNRANLTPLDLLTDSKDDQEIRVLIRKAQAQNTISRDDIPSDDEEDGEGSGSDSE